MPDYSNPDYDPNAQGGEYESDVSNDPAVIAAVAAQNGQPIAQAQPTYQAPAQDNGPTHISYYGYKDDPTPDSNSRNHIGDRGNILTEGDSVALSHSKRQELFGVTGKSTGLPVNIGGVTYYDHDTSPQGFKNIDIFAPSINDRQARSMSFKTWEQDHSPQQQYPYDPNKDPLSGTEAFTPPASPPPSWNDLTTSQEWQGLSPEDKGKVADQWYSQSFNYAGSLGNFQSGDRQKLYDFYQDARKQATYVPPLDLGKTAGNTFNEIGRQFKEDTLKADAGAYQHEIQTPNVSPEQVNQLIEQANSIPGLTDAQKQQNEQTIRGANQAKQDIIQKWAKDKQQEVQQTEAEKKPDAPGLATATGHLLATAAPVLVGAPLGPAGMAMTGSLSQGNIGYEDGLEESSKWLAKNHPELSPEERQVKAIAAANKISDINSGFGLLMGIPGISIPKAAIPSLIPRIFAGTAINAAAGGAITGGQQYAQNQALRQTVSPEMTGEWTGVPEAAAQGAALFGGTHLLHEVPGAIRESRTTEQIPAATETPKTAENVPAGQPEPPRAALVDQAPATSTQPDVTTPPRKPGEAILGPGITSREEAPERITQAAIRNKETGEIHVGATHPQAFEKFVPGSQDPDEWSGVSYAARQNYDEGFTTSTGRYVGRDEAAEIARNANQSTLPSARNLDTASIKPESAQPVQETEPWVSGVVNRNAQEISPGEEPRAITGTPVDLSTPDGLREAWLRDVGTEPTPDVQANMTQTAQRVRVAADSERIAMQNLGERIDREPISDKIPDAETVRNNILERMGIDPCLN